MLPENPYHAWLGLPAELNKPNHYQLLQLSPADCTREVVIAAAQAQVAKLRKVARSAPKEAVRRLAKEIETAANCLGSSRARERYNQQLLAELAANPGNVAHTSPRADAATSSPRADAATISLPDPCEELPVAIPLDDDLDIIAAGPPSSTRGDMDSPPPADDLIVVGDARPAGAPSVWPVEPQSSPAVDPPEIPRIAEPTPAERAAALRRSQRRSPWGAALAGIVAVLLLAAAIGLIMRPDWLDGVFGRTREVAVGNEAEVPQRGGTAARKPSSPSPLDRAIHAAPPTTTAGDANRADDPTTVDPGADLRGAANPSAAVDGEPNEPPIEMASDSPADDRPAAGMASTAPPADLPLSRELVDVLLAASLYSVALGNFDAAAELYSYLTPAELTPDLSGRAQRLALVADLHARFQQSVLKSSAQVAGGETLELPGNRSVGIVEASPQLVVLKVLGTNRRYPPELLPTEIGLAFANRAAAAPETLSLFQANEALLQDVRRAIRGRDWDPAALQQKISESAAKGGDQAACDALQQFCRNDLPELLRDRADRSLWSPPAGEPDRWLQPLQAVRESVRPLQALNLAWTQNDPVGRAHLYREGISRYLAEQQLAALAIAATSGQLADPAAAGNLLAKIELGQLTKRDAQALARILIDRIASENEAGRTSLQRICRQVVSKHELAGYGEVLDQLSEQGD